MPHRIHKGTNTLYDYVIIINTYATLMYELKKIGKVFTSKFVGRGPSSYKNRIYGAAVSQRLSSSWYMSCVYVDWLLARSEWNCSKHVVAINRIKLKENSASCWSYCTDIRYTDIVLRCTVNKTLSLHLFSITCAEFYVARMQTKFWRSCPHNIRCWAGMV
jgi:hypothetical protein